MAGGWGGDRKTSRLQVRDQRRICEGAQPGKCRGQVLRTWRGRNAIVRNRLVCVCGCFHLQQESRLTGACPCSRRHANGALGRGSLPARPSAGCLPGRVSHLACLLRINPHPSNLLLFAAETRLESLRQQVISIATSSRLDATRCARWVTTQSSAIQFSTAICTSQDLLSAVRVSWKRCFCALTYTPSVVPAADTGRMTYCLGP